jgi:hypothetical protein
MKPASVLLPLTLIALAFAGCLEEPVDDAVPTRGADDALKYVVPALGKIDAKAFLANHSKFVTTYPYRANNAEGHLGARDYIEKEFEKAGLEVWRQKFVNGIQQENICAVKFGVVEPQTWVVVGGHYDTTTWDDGAGQGRGGSAASQGAYDDGSGTWITVEIAKALAKTPTAYSLLLCAFDGEERGLHGSAAVRKAMNEGGSFPYEVEDTRAMLDLDMFGINWPTRTPIYITQNNPVLMAKIQEKRKAMGIPDDMFKESGVVPSLGSSDYGNWIRDTPTVFFISDFSECAVPAPMNPLPTPGVPCSYPWWHWMDTTTTMTAMAGGADMSQKGFQTALDLSLFVVGLMAFDPALQLSSG